MPDPLTLLRKAPKRIGVAADHGGYELKEQLARNLREASYRKIGAAGLLKKSRNMWLHDNNIV